MGNAIAGKGDLQITIAFTLVQKQDDESVDNCRKTAFVKALLARLSREGDT